MTLTRWQLLTCDACSLDIDDAGNYICEVENEGDPIQQTNQLQILGEIPRFTIQILDWKYSSASKDLNVPHTTESNSSKGFKVNSLRGPGTNIDGR